MQASKDELTNRIRVTLHFTESQDSSRIKLHIIDPILSQLEKMFILSSAVIAPGGHLLTPGMNCDQLSLREGAVLLCLKKAGLTFKRWWRTDCTQSRNFRGLNYLHSRYWDALDLIAKVPVKVGGISVEPLHDET